MRRFGFVAIVAAAWWGGIGLPGVERTGPAVARAAERWRAEFDDVCSRTQDAMTLTSDELRSLVVRCDQLMPALEKLPDPERKVYTRRLQACRKLYQFVLDTRERA